MSATNKQSSQQYQLKLGVIHHPSLKTIQLIQFLENQANEFLHNDLPQYIKGDQKFVNVMESFPIENQQLSQYSFQQYVGLLLIYSTSSEQSYQFFHKTIQSILSLDVGDLFLVVVQMDNSDKQANLIGNVGQKFCSNNSLQFVRLSLYNSEDLISMINRNLYELIENYYYPNEELQQAKQPSNPLKLEIQQNRSTSRSKQQKQNRSSSRQKDSQYVFSYDQANSKVKAFNQNVSPSKHRIDQMLSQAASLRKSRQKQILVEQQQIDESIQNLENIINNINPRIKEKLQSGWFTSIKNNLYLSSEKDNQNFSKIKLTQQFIDDAPKKNRKPLYSVVQSRYSDVIDQSSKTFALNFNSLKFNPSLLKSPILKIVFFYSKEKVVQLQIYDNSTYQQLASIALKRFGLRQTEKNTQIMIEKIRRRIQSFSKQFHRAIKVYEQKKIQQRSFLKAKTNQEQQ